MTKCCICKEEFVGQNVCYTCVENFKVMAELSERRRAMLAKHEFSASAEYHGDFVEFCPECEGTGHASMDHTPDCELAALIKEGES